MEEGNELWTKRDVWAYVYNIICVMYLFIYLKISMEEIFFYNMKYNGDYNTIWSHEKEKTGSKKKNELKIFGIFFYDLEKSILWFGLIKNDIKFIHIDRHKDFYRHDRNIIM